ncbi:GIY-YIG catalytic domain-containing endonuclease [Paramecium bursaria Chlorella virus NE-JV-1]|nr:GIY-YIG catalytic domain-containing endonuclease [Paramecium bursaria Chlorella virus NE-JV-1]
MKIIAEKTGIIYRIAFPNGKSYIGQTSRTVFQRGAEHLRQSSGCIKLKNAFNKYGHDECEMSILKDKIPVNYLDWWENKFIDQFDSIASGYNIKYNEHPVAPEDQDLEPETNFTAPKKVNPFEKFANKEYVAKKKIEVLLPKKISKKIDSRPWLRLPAVV